MSLVSENVESVLEKNVDFSSEAMHQLSQFMFTQISACV